MKTSRLFHWRLLAGFASDRLAGSASPSPRGTFAATAMHSSPITYLDVNHIAIVYG